MGARDHVRDGLGFHFDDSAAVAAALVLVKEHVPGFVGQGLDGLGVVDVVPDHHEPLAKVGRAVSAAEVCAAIHVESSFSEEVLQSVPQPCGGLASEEQSIADLGVGQRRTVCLADVEHRDGLRADDVCPVHGAALVIAHRVAGVIEAGQDEIAHVHSFHQDYFRGFDPAHVFREYEVDDAFGERVTPQLLRAGIAVTTTLIVDQALADAHDIDAYVSRPEMAYETPGAAAFMRSPEWTFDNLWQKDYLTRVYLPHLFRLTHDLQRGGVSLVLGTDSGVTGVVYGFSAHQELQLLVEAGLSPYEALLTGTRNAAAAVRSRDWGTIERGRRADLLLVRDNPLEHIGNTRHILGVMKRGHWLDRAELDRLLAQVREAYQ